MSGPIQKRILTNGLMLAAMMALALTILFNPKEEEQLNYISDIAKDSISKITIGGAKTPITLIKLETDGWLMTEPVRTYVNNNRVNGLLNLLTAESENQLSMNEVTAEDFGLDSPAGIIQYDGNIFTFGDRDPVEGKRYVRFGDTLHVLADTHLPLAHAPLDTFYNFKLIPEFINRQVASYQLPDFTISRNESGGWSIDPEDPNLTSDDIQKWVGQWEYSQAAKIENVTGLDTSKNDKFIITLTNGKTIEYSIIREGEWFGYYSEPFEATYHLSEYVLKDLINKPVAATSQDPTQTP